MEGGDNKKVAWNAAQGLIAEISNRRSYANSFYINGDIRKAFKTLISIKQSVIQSFDTDQRKELQTIEDNFNKLSLYLVPSNSSSFNKSTSNAYTEAKTLATIFYSKYNNLLMDLLNKMGYLIGEQSDSSRMKF